ncbi:LuxR family transcriptional regulator [bacterium]|nr:MAG: LuxR family transcriptional regulator [bacterium]
MARSTPAYVRVFEEKRRGGLIGFDLFHGNRFRVGPAGYRVNALGYNLQISLPSPRLVALFDEDDEIVVRAELSEDDRNDGWDRWREIAPVDLVPGMTYTLAAFVPRGAVDLFDEGVAQVSDGLEDLGSWYFAGDLPAGRPRWEPSGGYRQYIANVRGTPLSALSSRLREIIDLASHGLTDKEISARLGIGVQTIETYWKRLREFYGASNRTEVVARSLEDLYRQAHRALAMERERLLKAERDRRPEEEARRRSEENALRELARLQAENARLRGDNRHLRSLMTSLETSGAILYDEELRTCTDNVGALGIDPADFREGRDSVTLRTLAEDLRRTERNARLRTFRVLMPDGAHRWVLETRGEGATALAIPLDLLGGIDAADRERFFAYVGESALAMWRRPTKSLRGP